MDNYFKKLVLFSALIVLFSPFKVWSDGEKDALNGEKNKIESNNSFDDKEKAQKLADLGEAALESPKVADKALEVFEDALKYDSQNAKANFYSAILAPLLTLKGLPVKMTPILKSVDLDEEVEREMKELVRSIKNSDIRRLVKDFLYDSSGEAYKTISEFQSFVTSKLLPTLKEAQKRLEIAEKADGFKTSYAYGNWGSRGSRDSYINIDQVEAHAVRVVINGIASLAKLASVYNVDSAVSIYNRFKDQRHVTPKMIVDAVKRDPKALTLHAGGADILKSILNDASDSVEGLRILANSLRNYERRYKHPIQPFTSQAEYEKFIRGLDVASDVLSGPFVVTIGKNKRKKETYTVDVNFTALFANPVQDLKAILPTRFDMSGKKVVRFPDLTFGGVVPGGDLIDTYCAIPERHRTIELPVVCY